MRLMTEPMYTKILKFNSNLFFNSSIILKANILVSFLFYLGTNKGVTLVMESLDLKMNLKI